MKNPKKDEKSNLLNKIFNTILTVLKEEKCSTAGKFNFCIDILLIILLIFMLSYNGLEIIIQGIQNIFAICFMHQNNSLDSGINIFYFVSVLLFVAVCLFFMYFTSKNKEKYNNSSSIDDDSNK